MNFSDAITITNHRKAVPEDAVTVRPVPFTRRAEGWGMCAVQQMRQGNVYLAGLYAESAYMFLKLAQHPATKEPRQ